MTDRLCGFIVVLDKDLREDDAQEVLNALRMIKHVISVEPVGSDHVTHIARERALLDLRKKLIAVLYPEREP